MMKSILIMAFIIIAIVWQQRETKLPIDEVNFQIDNAGMEVNGTFSGIKTQIKFNSDNLAQSSIVASVDASTINTKIPLRDKHLKKSDYFDVSHYQSIKMNSTKFRKTSRNQFEGTFNLTIKDLTKEVIIPFSLIRKANLTRLKGSFKINRTDYQLGTSSTILSDTVTINIQTTFL